MTALCASDTCLARTETECRPTQQMEIYPARKVVVIIVGYTSLYDDRVCFIRWSLNQANIRLDRNIQDSWDSDNKCLSETLIFRH